MLDLLAPTLEYFRHFMHGGCALCNAAKAAQALKPGPFKYWVEGRGTGLPDREHGIEQIKNALSNPTIAQRIEEGLLVFEGFFSTEEGMLEQFDPSLGMYVPYDAAARASRKICCASFPLLRF
jgi:hypothetical protein